MSSTVTNPEKMKSMANDAIDSAEEKTFDTLEAARGKAERAVDKVHAVETDIQESVAEISGTVTRFINEKPLQAAGMAFAAGVLATLILSKR